jgi:hypothetical protein
MNELADLFAKQKYVVWRLCLKEPRLSLLYRYATKHATLGSMFHDAQVPSALAAHGDIFMDALLLELLPIAEAVSRLKLFPTYSYFRVYRQGDVLEKHTDRPACEISMTLCLGYRAGGPWPILIDGPNGISSIELGAGDAMFYRGIECPHWRDPFEGEETTQVFLHYVDQNGPYAEWKYDKRPHLNFPQLKVEDGFEQR